MLGRFVLIDSCLLGEITALEALSEGLANLADISNFMADKFDQALQERKFEVSDETNW